ncbi:MAG: tetratricopeptide repeat protein [Telluria sp.]
MPSISNELQAEIDYLCAQGDAHADLDRFPDALALYWQAWDLLPEPKIECDAATWILAAVGDANFLGRDYEAGIDNLSTVMHCPGGIGIPFLHMRLGQCQFELGDHARAIDELERAYLGGGPDLFEDEDPKYRDFLEAHRPEPERKAWQFWR